MAPAIPIPHKPPAHDKHGQKSFQACLLAETADAAFFQEYHFFESHQHISHDIAEHSKKQIWHIAEIIEPSRGTAISVCIQHGDFSSFFIQDRCCRFLLGKTGFQICPHGVEAVLKLLIYIIC